MKLLTLTLTMLLSTAAIWCNAQDEPRWRESQHWSPRYGGEPLFSASRLAARGDVAIVSNGSTNGATILERELPSGRWCERAIVSGQNFREGFGRALAADGFRVAVGAPYQNPNTGRAILYHRNAGRWEEEAVLTASDGADRDLFGISIAIDKLTLALGATGVNNATGAVYIFVHDGTSWVERQKITAANGAAGDDFGHCVAMRNGVLVIGTYSSDGKAYVYRFDENSQMWIEFQELTSKDSQNDDLFGTSVAIDGPFIAVGAHGRYPGAVYVFQESPNLSWVEQATIRMEGTQKFGWDLAIHQGSLLVGAPESDLDRGRAFLFRAFEGAWGLEQELIPGDLRSQDKFGDSVALQNGSAIVGSTRRHDSRGGLTFFSTPSSLPTPESSMGEASHVRRRWTVGGEGADFPEIQPAIDSAGEGDLILVDPIKTYSPFELYKGVTISSPFGRFKVDVGDVGMVSIRDIPASAHAIISRMDLSRPGWGNVQTSDLAQIVRCEGIVIIEDSRIALGRGFGYPQGRSLVVENCALVQLTQVEISGGIAGYYRVSEGSSTALDISNAKCMISRSYVRGGHGGDYHNDSFDGHPGIRIDSAAEVVLSNTFVRGGDGGLGLPTWYSNIPGGNGGSGIEVVDGKVLIEGRIRDEVRGGNGGDGGSDVFGKPCWGEPGDGGDGIQGMAAVSGMTLRGGSQGCGYLGGRPGLPHDGGVETIEPPVPSLSVPGQLTRGDVFQVSVFGETGDIAWVVLSNRLGWGEFNISTGAPWMMMAGDFFVPLFIGEIGPDGYASEMIALDRAFVLEGFSLSFQGSVLRGPSALFTSSFTRIIR